MRVLEHLYRVEYVIVIPWVVRLYVEIIHEITLHIVKLFYTTYISVDLAHHEILVLKLVKVV